MFDFYRLPADVPEVSIAEKENDPYEKVHIIEQEILKNGRLDSTERMCKSAK